ncbi:helix-turn-helix transcriptional regulator, partial [Streptomyces sp. NPDC096080]|uniref:helix-turn-helix domain-containing protein n=1 Tax=Streptomyces sp. NPDC096080 TaxID=3156693 RepID=UPI003333F405
MSEMFDAVDALVASRAALPSAEERKRLRVAHGLTLDDVAGALKVRRATVSAWESVKKPTEPRGPEREAYARLLRQLAELYPAPAPAPPGPPAPAEAADTDARSAAPTVPEQPQDPVPAQGAPAP